MPPTPSLTHPRITAISQRLFPHHTFCFTVDSAPPALPLLLWCATHSNQLLGKYRSLDHLKVIQHSGQCYNQKSDHLSPRPLTRPPHVWSSATGIRHLCRHSRSVMEMLFVSESQTIHTDSFGLPWSPKANVIFKYRQRQPIYIIIRHEWHEWG